MKKKLFWFLREFLCPNFTKHSLLLLFITFAYSIQAQRQTENSFRSRFGPNALVGYLAYLPSDYYTNPSKNYPILLFLHGMGEKVWNPQDISQLYLLKKYGPPKLIEEGHNFPFIVISPQCPFSGWDDISTDGFYSTQWRPGEFVDEIIEKMKTLYRVDPSRIYLTGVSMGGSSVWEYLQRYPHKIAASIPIAGWINDYNTCGIARNNVALWAFQGEYDGGYNIQSYINQINACSPAPNPKAKATVYTGLGHDAWTITYNNTGPGIAPDNIYDWLMRHSKTATAPNNNNSNNITYNGLTMELYPSRFMTGTVTTTTSPNINYNWGNGAPIPNYRHEDFSIRWTGFIQPKFNETYTFYTNTDDGIRLWIDGQLVIDNWTDHASTENMGRITLVAGRKHSIKLEYYENYGQAEARLSWSSTSVAKQIVPQDCLFFPNAARMEESEQLTALDMQNDKIEAYPIPTKNLVNVSFVSLTPCDAKIQLINELAEVVLEQPISLKPGKNEYAVNLSTLKQGIYSLHIMDKDYRKGLKVIVSE